MNKKNRIFISLLLISISVSACQERRASEIGGEITGGAAGALIGAQIGAGTGQIAAAGVGAVIGALAGGEIARSSYETSQKPQNEGRITTGISPTPQRRAFYCPQRKKLAPEHLRKGLCYREYTHRVIIDGKLTKVHGTAYMKKDGSWHIYSTAD